MTFLAFDGVEKHFGDAVIIRGITFSIREGEFVVLVGPSGCGKSTLLRMLAGLESVDKGSIVIEEKIVNDTASKDRDIAMVFQSYALYPHMTVRENMGFSLKMRKLGREAITERVEWAAGILGLTPYLDRRPRDLSGGQRQRVAMGRAIVRDPKVFLFDEPLSNLDAKLRVAMRAEIKALHQRLKTTTVYVTHDQIEAMTMADRIVVMREGQVEQIGTPLELYDKPANLFVAQFIGSPSMNIVQGKIEAGKSSDVFKSSGGEWPSPPVAGASRDQLVAYGIRPEHLKLADASETGTICGEVTVVEPTGSNVELHVRVGESVMTATIPGRPPARPGDQISFTVDPAFVHVFDAVHGNRLNLY